MKKIYCYFLGIMLTAGFFCYRYSKITETSDPTDTIFLRSSSSVIDHVSQFIDHFLPQNLFIDH